MFCQVRILDPKNFPPGGEDIREEDIIFNQKGHGDFTSGWLEIAAPDMDLGLGCGCK
jgi:hypothetical protein